MLPLSHLSQKLAYFEIQTVATLVQNVGFIGLDCSFLPQSIIQNRNACWLDIVNDNDPVRTEKIDLAYNYFEWGWK